MMKNLYTLFFGIFFALAFSFTGLIVSSEIQIGDLQPTTSALLDDEGNEIAGTSYFKTLPDGETLEIPGMLNVGEPMFPQKPLGLAQRGKQVYIEQGCMYCHSQQVRPKGFGADHERGWGERQAVARDYILQDRVLLGTMRTGPDLMNVGDRGISQDGGNWHHLHLYNPQMIVEGSTMPPFAFLYKEQPIMGLGSPDALVFEPGSEYAPAEGYEIVPTERAEALVAYLLSLKFGYELPEAKMVE